ncbi:hypothetical protein M514_28468, partial [Trichuris suis]
VDVHHDCIQICWRISVFPLPEELFFQGELWKIAATYDFSNVLSSKFCFTKEYQAIKSTGNCWKSTRTMPSPIPESSFGSRGFAGAENPSLTNQGLVGLLKPSLMKVLQLWRRWFWRTEESRLQKSWHGLSFLVAQLKAFYMIT